MIQQRLTLKEEIFPGQEETTNHGKKSILYISTKSIRVTGNDYFDKVIQFDSLSIAKRNLRKILKTGKKLPDLILIDIAYETICSTDFNRFLLKNNILQSSVVIYNETSIDSSDLQFAIANNVADDIMQVNCINNELGQKVMFLQEAKQFLVKEKNEKTTLKKNRTLWVSPVIAMAARRFLDIMVATMLIIVLFPLMLVIAVMIKLESGGPVIYRSKRSGQGCRIFDFYKFRTMMLDADVNVIGLKELNQYPNRGNSPLFFKALNDPRITRIGSILRNTSLDELPQLFNVFLGDMSIVGNRPLPLYEAATLTNDRWAERFMAPAGMTGLWQVLKRGRKEMSMEDRMRLDIKYARNYNITRDMWILVNTPRALFQKTSV